MYLRCFSANPVHLIAILDAAVSPAMRDPATQRIINRLWTRVKTGR
jgi:hypothetical protein